MTIPALACLLMPLSADAQKVLTLEDCHKMAVENSKTLSQARTQVEMAGYDRKIALANYFPNLSVSGTYQYNNRDIALVSDAQSAAHLQAWVRRRRLRWTEPFPPLQHR